MSDVLQHSGVKGMKWGVRKDRGHEGERAKTKKIDKLDKQFDRNSQSMHTTFAIHNKAADLTNKNDIDRINNKPEYQGQNFLKPSPLREKYYKEHHDAYLKNIETAAKEMGTNASGTKKYGIAVGDDGSWDVRVVDVEHAADPSAMRVKVYYDANGFISKLEPLDPTDDTIAQGEDFAEGYFLKHYGIKGMRWGVRRDKTPTDVTVKAQPGRLVKTKGGARQPAAEDAIRAARIRQQAKKSSVDSLSNAELKALVERMNLEQQYNRLKDDPARLSMGSKMARTALEGGGAEIAVMGLAKGAAAAGLATNPQVAVGLKVSTMIASRLTEKAIVKSGNSRELQKYDTKNDTFNKLKPDYAEKMAEKAAKAAKKK